MNTTACDSFEPCHDNYACRIHAASTIGTMEHATHTCPNGLGCETFADNDSRCSDCATPAPTISRDEEFSQWLKSEGFMFGMRPTPERMLQSPDSLRAAQRAWLRDYIARGK